MREKIIAWLSSYGLMTLGLFLLLMASVSVKTGHSPLLKFPVAGPRLEAQAGGDAAFNAEILRGILSGNPGPARDIVVLNAAAAIYAANKAGSLKEGVGLANGSIDSGSASKKLDLLKDFSQRNG